MRRILALAALPLLAGCAEPAPMAAVPGPVFTAAAGEVMALSDGCVAQVCGPGGAGGLSGVQQLVYLGMRSDQEAVFERIEGPFDGPTRPSGVAGVLVPDRPERQDDGAAPYIPRRDPGAAPVDGVTEIVLDPAVGAEFGVGHLDVIVTEISPGRVVYMIGTM
ncbi:MAG: hypothetical protein ACK4WC_05400 [Rubrimonas sp.]